MSTSAISAANAYGSAARLLGTSTQPKATAMGDASGFSNLVKAAFDGTAETGKAAESKAAELASGKADVVDLVTAVAETELAIETLVTVRDRVISAYQDIMSMPI